MLGGSEFRLRRGFACGKTLVRRKGAAGQKAGWAVCRTFSILQIKISISPLTSALECSERKSRPSAGPVGCGLWRTFMRDRVRISRERSSPILGIDLLLQLVEIHPPLRLLLQGGLQLRLPGLELLELHVVAAAGRLLRLAGGDVRLQLGQVVVDGLELPLLLEGEFQLPLPGPLCGGLCFFRFGGGGLRLPALGLPVGPVAGEAVNLPVSPDLEDGLRQLVQEEAVVGHRQNGAGEALEIVLQDGEGGHVQVVGGLVQQQDVGGLHQHGQQVQPPPLPAGEPPDGHGLEIPGEQKPLHHLVGGEGALVGLHLVGDVVDEVVDPLLEVQLPPLLGEVADLHRGAHLHRAAVRRQLPRDQVEQGGLAGAVAAHDADAVAAQQVVGEVADDGPPVKGLGHIPQLDDLLPQAAGGRRHLDGFVRLRRVLVQQGLVPLDALLGLGGAGPAAPHDPLPLHPEDGLALALTGLRHLLPLLPQLQVLGVVGLIVVQLPPGELRDVVHHPLQEVPVMGHHDQAALEPAEPVLQPGYHLAVQMVGGLVQNQHVRRVDQGRRQGHPLPLAAGERPHLLGKVCDPQPVQHGLGLILIQLPELGGEVEEDLLQHRGGFLHCRVLRQQTDLDVGVPGDGAAVRLRDAGEHL